MNRIPDEDIERLKNDVAVERLAEARGVKLKRHGADLIGLCPFHDDHEPSLVITPSKNLWHCLGACRTGGTAIDWVMKAERVGFREAVEMLQTDLPPLVASAPAELPKTSMAEHVFDDEDRALLARVVEHYRATINMHRIGPIYLAKRGLIDETMIDHFKLGLAERTLGTALAPTDSTEHAQTRTRLLRLGLLRKSGHEHFHGSLVIPLFDEAGAVVGMYGRKVGAKLREGSPRHLYLPGPHRGVFNREGIKGCKSVILCEALIDALTFWCAGYRNVTSSYGIEGFTPELLEALKSSGAERILIAYDRDDAGDAAAAALAVKLAEEGFEPYRIEFSPGMDANEYAVKYTPANQTLGWVIESARSMIKAQAANLAPTLATTTAVPGAKSMPAPCSHEVSAALTEPVKADDSIDQEVEADALPVAEPIGILSSSTERPSPIVANSTANVSSKPTSDTSWSIAPMVDLPVEIKAEELNFTIDDRRYRIRGFAKNLSHGYLKVNILAVRREAFHVDTVELYSARHRAAFVKQTALELSLREEVVKKDLGRILLKLEELQDAQIRAALEPKKKEVVLTPEQEAAALELLKDPRLLDRLLEDFEHAGVVGEQTNKLVAYIAAVSRKLEDPLAVIIQSSSAAGKSSLMEAVLAFIPAEDRVKYSAMTGQSLYYLGQGDLKHKILAVVEEEGAERASYALKLLQSEHELTIASTGKDPVTGKMVTQEYRVEGPVMIFLTTTAIEIDDELLNRCIVLTVDEDREQTKAIHRLQRKKETLEGRIAEHDRSAILTLHANAQRLIRPLLVANPFAEALTFIDTRTRTRRDHMKYLVLIRAIALLHQHQRPLKTMKHKDDVLEYIEVAHSDIALANRLAHEVLGRSLKELPPQTERLLLAIDRMVTEGAERNGIERSEYRFTRRDVREHTGWGNTQLKLHLHRLEELEYLVHRGGRSQRFEYELVYDGAGKDGSPFLSGLIDVSQLQTHHDVNRSGHSGDRSPLGRGQVGPRSGGGRSAKNSDPVSDVDELEDESDDSRKNALKGARANGVVAVLRNTDRRAS